jgi:hypothetical protein
MVLSPTKLNVEDKREAAARLLRTQRRLPKRRDAAGAHCLTSAGVGGSHSRTFAGIRVCTIKGAITPLPRARPASPKYPRSKLAWNLNSGLSLIQRYESGLSLCLAAVRAERAPLHQDGPGRRRQNSSDTSAPRGVAAPKILPRDFLQTAHVFGGRHHFQLRSKNSRTW